ncbi:uncharacterized transposon-derived protein F54H12.3 [Trichonephila clavipes]|nr:uncharacterized transposon-derived protein F54H12.3 [Trichonephila clavipes]
MNQQFQADLVDMQSLTKFNDGYRFLLTCICVLSKYAWAIPLHDKNAKTIVSAFERIFSERIPLKLQTDAGLDWDDKLLKQLEVSWNKWCDEIHYLSEINIPRYYFQNFLPSNATTIQLHCFSDASKKAYEIVAYLRIELNDGNIISSFVVSKGRVAPLKLFRFLDWSLWTHFYQQG